MTAILKDIRALDARLKSGDMTPAQHARARAILLQSIEDANTEFEASPSASGHTQKDAHGTSAALGFSITVCLGVMGGSIALILLFLPDLNLALTLGVTLLAALTVALFRALDD